MLTNIQQSNSGSSRGVKTEQQQQTPTEQSAAEQFAQLLAQLVGGEVSGDALNSSLMQLMPKHVEQAEEAPKQDQKETFDKFEEARFADNSDKDLPKSEVKVKQDVKQKEAAHSDSDEKQQVAEATSDNSVAAEKVDGEAVTAASHTPVQANQQKHETKAVSEVVSEEAVAMDLAVSKKQPKAAANVAQAVATQEIAQAVINPVAVANASDKTRAVSSVMTQLTPFSGLLEKGAKEVAIGQDQGLPKFGQQSNALAQLLSAHQLQGAGLMQTFSEKAAGQNLNDRGFRLPTQALAGLDSLVKTSETKSQNPVNRLAPSAQSNIIQRIQQVAEAISTNRDTTSVVVKLDPQELGEITIRVTQRADQIFAKISPESRDVEQFLRANVKELGTALSGIGLKGENIHVSVGQEVSEGALFGFSESLMDRGATGDRQNENSADGQLGHNFEQEMNMTSDQTSAVDSFESGWVA